MEGRAGGHAGSKGTTLEEGAGRLEQEFLHYSP